MARKNKDLTDEQYAELKAIANSYNVTLGGYQNNHGYTLYTSEAVAFGSSYSELVSDLHKVGRQAQKRIKRTIHASCRLMQIWRPWRGSNPQDHQRMTH